ncbi:MAG: hypothetical protein ABIG93_03730 [archaeon]|nr:hypothetical protein [Nanoarchaeota archaeon]
MVFKKLLLVLALVSLILLTACQGQQVDTTSGAFIGGTDGIVLSFEPFSIMEDGVYTIFDTEDFPIELVIKNMGENTVEPGDVVLTLIGPAHEDFSNIPDWEKSNTEEIEKISEFNPTGGEEIISFTPNAYAKYNSEIIGYNDVTWNINYKYDYETTLIINDVCFKGDLTDEKVCEVQEYKSYSVSGAPITITSVEEDTAGKGIVLLKIQVSNVGTGDSTIQSEDFDNRFSQVAYEIESPEDWECKSGGQLNEARMIDGKAEVICRLNEPLAESDLYSDSITLTFSYTYQDLIFEKLRIKESAS